MTNLSGKGNTREAFLTPSKMYSYVIRDMIATIQSK